MSSVPRLDYHARPGADSELELDALSRIYARAIEKYLEAKAVGITSTDGDDTKARSVDDFRAITILRQQ